MGENELILPDAKSRCAREIADNVKKLLPALAGAAGINQNEFLTACIVAANEISDKDKVDPTSVLIAAFNCARIRLCPGGVLGLAYFVPFKGKCQLIIGYKGYLELAFRNNFLISCHPEVVLNDEVRNGQFKYWVDENGGAHFRHDYDPFQRATPDRTNVAGAYCTWKSRDGGYGVRAVSRADINKIDKGQDSKFWRENYVGACLKTPVRRASSMWQTCPEMKMASYLDSQVDREEIQEDLFQLQRSPHTETLDLADYKDAEGEERATT